MTDAPAEHHSEQGISTSTYSEMRPSSSKVAICVRNLLAKPVIIPAKITIGSVRTVSTAIIIPPMIEPKIKTIEENQWEETDANKAKLCKEKWEILFYKLDLSGLDDWDQD